MNALIVDDVAIIRKSISKNLSKMDRIGQVYEANDGLEGLNVLEEDEHIELIITDWNMPELNGMDMVIKIRENPKFKDIYIIMITAQDSKELVIEAVTNGVDDYIVKPYNIATLMKKVERVFSTK